MPQLLNTEPIQAGITRKDAIEKCLENDNYYMVKFSEGNTGLTYIISEGDDIGMEVELKGNNP